MAETPKVYVLCDANCRWESMTKEQIYTAIAQAVSTGSIGNCDTGFITTVKTISGAPLRFFVGTQYEYSNLSEADKANLFAIITDDVDKEALFTAIETLQRTVNEVSEGVRNGDIVVAQAAEADHARVATNADYATHDDKKRHISTNYLSIAPDNTVYAGDAKSGVTIYGRTQSAGGAAYLATWEVDEATLCFGVIWWDGSASKQTRSLPIKYWNADYCVVIEQVVATGNVAAGKATVCQIGTGNPTTITKENTTLTLRRLTANE